ncbi:MAG: hypothetical protein KBA51_05630 [Kiritimatiellae bacterium]|nr:hypothetical protein [Kiritimatiellia bacterium]
MSLKEHVKKPVEPGLCFGQLRFLPGKDSADVLRLASLQLVNPALPFVEPVAKPGLAGLGSKLAGQDFLAGVFQRATAFPLRASVVVVSLLQFGGDRSAALPAEEISPQGKGGFLLLPVRAA